MNPICWASINGGCRGELTKEHVISASVLKIIGNIRVGKERDEYKTFGTGSYVLKRLCEHHNSELSKYDDEARKFFSALTTIGDVLKEVSRPNNLSEQREFTIGKLHLERWFAKTFMNMVLFNTTVFKPENLPFYVTPQSIINQLYNGSLFKPPFGLYLIKPGNPIVPENEEGFKIFESNNVNLIKADTGIRSEPYNIPLLLHMNFTGVHLAGVFNATPLQDKQAKDSFLKPTIDLLNERASQRFSEISIQKRWSDNEAGYNAKIKFV